METSSTGRSTTPSASSIQNEAVAGIAAGIVGTVLGFPFDTIKTRMQTNKANSSIFFIGKTIYNEGSFLGFYRGVASPLLALTILNMLNFTSYANFCKLLHVDTSGIIEKRRFEWKVGVAAALVGPLSSLISTPFELVKIQMQLSQSRQQGTIYRNSIHAAYSIVTNYSLKGLYTGHKINTFREIVFLSTYFTTYEHLKSGLLHHSYGNFTSSIAVPLSGGLAGSMGWFVSFPLDCIKGNIQGRELGTLQNEGVPKISDTFHSLIKQKGVRGLYSGLLPSITRAFIVSSSRFSAFEATLYFINENGRKLSRK